MNMQF
jgi:cation-transporting ATPase 13A2